MPESHILARMCTGILFFLLFLVMVTYRLGKRRLASLLFILSFLLLFAVGSGVLPSILLEELQTSPDLRAPNWQNKNAIVVLGGGTVKDGESVKTAAFAISRELEALVLYRSCKENVARVCHVLLSGGDPLKNGKAEAEVMAETLRAAGVSSADLVIEGKSANTFQNAQFTSQMLFAGNYDQVVLVTSGIHMKRAQLYFAHFSEVPEAAPADKSFATLGFVPRSFNFALMDLALHEWIGIARLYVYNVLGLNTPSEIRR